MATKGNGFIIMTEAKEELSTIRSRTFLGIAVAMAEQWGNL